MRHDRQDFADEMALCVELDFRLGGNARPHLIHGWSRQETEFTWTEGGSSELAFDAPAPGRYMLCLDAIALGQQRLAVTINTELRKKYRLAGECSVTLAIDVRENAGKAPIVLQLETPDATSTNALFGEADTRILAFAFTRIRLLRREKSPRILPPIAPADIEPATGLAPADLMYHFESLGHNCEFGIVQRLSGAEPMGLLRFASITLPNLLRGLSTGFEGLGAPDGISHVFWEQSPDPEYIIRDEIYGLNYHSGIRKADIAPEDLYRREARRLAFYRRKFLDDIAEQSKIFVFHATANLMTREVMPLLAALAHGTLLWVVANSEHPPGTVEVLAPGFLRGHLDHFAPIDTVALDVDLPPWLSLCANAFRETQAPSSI